MLEFHIESKFPKKTQEAMPPKNHDLLKLAANLYRRGRRDASRGAKP